MRKTPELNRSARALRLFFWFSEEFVYKYDKKSTAKFHFTYFAKTHSIFIMFS